LQASEVSEINSLASSTGIPPNLKREAIIWYKSNTSPLVVWHITDTWENNLQSSLLRPSRSYSSSFFPGGIFGQYVYSVNIYSY
jgi:hypothetical protein